MRTKRVWQIQAANLALAFLIALVPMAISAFSQRALWTPPRTADGQPDIQGVWSNASIIALERPNELQGKQFFTPEELTAYEAKVFARTIRDKPPAPGSVGTYNDFWWDRDSRRALNLRTSLIVDPPDGRVPPLTPEAQKRVQAERAYSKDHPSDGPEHRPLAERCIVFPMTGPPILPSFYNNSQYGPLTSNYQIIQAPGVVVILAEILHETRIIPIDGRPHLPPTVRQWTGDSRGRWEGNTLVVETTNFTNKSKFRGADENLRLTERFTRTDRDTLLYEFTVDDPTVFTKLWKAEIPMIASKDPIYEHACHEGNYGLFGILGGARAEEREAPK
jgi:hypothetical protein